MNRTAPLVVAATLLAACSGDGDRLADPGSVSTTVQVDTSTAAPSTTDPVVADTTSAPTGSGSGATPSTAPSESDGGDPDPASTVPTIPVVPETGVPGLDSADAFCAAWSRFGGSWQVLLVGSTFLDDPQRVAEWEIAAAHVIAESYDDLLAHLPAELVDEAALVADGYFGVLDRRAEAAREALAAAGADTAAVTGLSEAWLAALAARDPADPDLDLSVPGELAPLVERAATDLRERRVPFHQDPSMVVEAETPLADAYLESACPDQGTLSGQEVDPG